MSARLHTEPCLGIVHLVAPLCILAPGLRAASSEREKRGICQARYLARYYVPMVENHPPHPQLFAIGNSVCLQQPAMWLIDTTTIELKNFRDSERPEYAILSHTWGSDEDEVTFREMSQPESSRTRELTTKKGYSKILHTCRLAKTRGWGYAWVDTCSIDKSSSAELTESINSMFRWYREAQECYVYLEDFRYGTLDKFDLDHPPEPSSLVSEPLVQQHMQDCKW